MANSPVDVAVVDWLQLDTSFVSSMGKIYGERFVREPKSQYLRVVGSGESGESSVLGTVGGVATLELTVRAKTPDAAGAMRQAVKTKMRSLRGVIGEYHYTAARLVGEESQGVEEASGMYAYLLTFDIEYTE